MWAKSFIEELKKLAFDSSFGAMREVSRDDPALIDEVKGDSNKININPKKAPVKKHTKEQKYFMSNEKGINTKKKKKTQGTVDTIQEM